MKKLLDKIFFKKLGAFNLITAAFGFVFGLVVVMLSINFYVKFDRMKAKNKNYIIINKAPKIGNSAASAGFTPNEIAEIQKQPFVNDIAGLYGSKYKIWLELDMLRLKTEFMFESIDDPQFLDVDNLPENWGTLNMDKFDPSKDVIPVIVSRDMLNLYNYVFAFSNKTTQIPQSMIENIEFDMYLFGNAFNGKEKYKAKVIGYSDRYASFIVPKKFVEWANRRYVNEPTDVASRIVVETKHDSQFDVEGYCAEKDYQANRDEIKSHEVINVLNIIIGILAVFGFLFIFFAVTIVNLIFSLIVTEVKNEIQLLLQQGYAVRAIQKHLVVYLTKFMSILALISVLIYFIGNYFTMDYVVKIFNNVSTSIETGVWISFVLFIGLSLFFSFLSIKKAMKQYN